jgi:hypothetical protein
MGLRRVHRYRLAIQSGSRSLQASFYLLVVWALASALAVGSC